MANKALIAIQDLTYTEKQYGLGVTISYVNGGVAGAETVAVTDKHIVVTIASGTSKASEIKTAVEDSVEASALVSVAVSGTATTAQVTCKNASLSGGVAVTAASKVIGPLLYTAKTAGTAGNSITILYEDGETAGSETVAVVSSAITVGIEDGVSTMQDVIDAIEGDVSADALVEVVSNGRATSNPVFVASAPTATSLAGGLAATAPSTIVQDITFSSDTTGTANNGKKISYTTGATAASEVVTVSATDVEVQIENGVSTATQIKAALDASEDFNGVRATGEIEVVSYAAAHLTAATGTIVVDDYSLMNESQATGTITVADYTKLSPVAATGTVEVVDYTKLASAVATPSGTITFGTPDNGDTIILTGLPTDGTKTFTKVASDPGANEFSSISELTALIQATEDLNASDNGTVITIVVHTAGTAMNSATITGTGTYSALSVTFSGGQDNAALTVAGTVLTQGTDWTAETSNDVTADNIVAVLPVSVTGINTAGSIALTAADEGTAGNAIALVTTDETNLTITGALLTGGQDAVSITVEATTIVAGTDFTAETSNTVTASNIADALDTAFVEEVAASTDAVVTFTYPTAGADGNVALTTDDAVSSLTLSGASLTGGRDSLDITVDTNSLVAGTDFTAETSNDVTATNIAAAIDTAVGEEAASATTDTVTITWPTAGTVGNAIVLSSDDAVSSVTLSGATLSGGVDALEIVVGEDTLVESTDFTAETDEDTTATNLASAIDALTGVSASATDAIVTIVSDSYGTAGNATVLTTSDITAATVSAATLLGGTDALQATISGTGSTAQKTVNAIATAGAVGLGADAYFNNAVGTALTTAFVRQAFGFGANKITINNDETSGTNQVIGSFDGVNTHVTLNFGESIILDKYANGIWFKYGVGAPAYRVTAV